MNISYKLVKRSITRKSIVLRIVAGIILVYFLRMVQVSIFLSGNLFEGVYWSSSGAGALFPIPNEPGIATVMTLANLVDSLIFVVLINNGIWMLFVVILVLYLISPVTIPIAKKTKEGANSSLQRTNQ